MEQIDQIIKSRIKSRMERVTQRLLETAKKEEKPLEFSKFEMGFSFAKGKTNDYAIVENSHNRKGKYYYLLVNGVKQNTRAELSTCVLLANQIENGIITNI